MTPDSLPLPESPRCRDSTGLAAPFRARHMPEASRLDALRTFRRRPVPSTVWLCGQDGFRFGAGVVAWLLAAVAKIVTTYTEPGQRVLLLVPPRAGSSENTGSSVGVRTGPWRSRYEGLQEAGWVISRLGRGVRYQLVGTRTNPLDCGSDNHAVESESGPELRATEPDLNDNLAPGPDGGSGPGDGPTRSGLNSYDLIIAAAESRTSDCFRPADWTALLAPEGTLAVITHGDHSRGRYAERVGSLVRAAQLAGLSYLDRITLVNTSVHNGAPSESAAHQSGSPRLRRGASVAVGPHDQVHDDLLVFVHKSFGPSRRVSGEASDD